MITKVRATIAALFLTFAGTSQAAIIEYDAVQLSGSQWRYDYFVTNDSLATPIYEFTIDFEVGHYQSLFAPTAPVGWDPLAIQPNPSLPSAGFYDALALADGIFTGQTVAGFSVLFDWLGAGTPGSQFFQVIDPTTFDTLATGTTQVRVTTPPTAVPEPSTIALMLLGVLAIVSMRKRPLLRYSRATASMLFPSGSSTNAA